MGNIFKKQYFSKKCIDFHQKRHLGYGGGKYIVKYIYIYIYTYKILNNLVFYYSS